MSSATAPRPPNVGNPFVLGGTVTNGSGSLQTINTPFTMTAVRTFTGGTDIALAGNIGGSGGGISKSGSNTLILSGTNNYTGQTTVGPGVIRLDSANAVPGGIADTGGISNINLNGGVLGLAAGTQVSRSDVTRGVMKYAKDHKLTDKQAIKPDATLRKLLGLTEADSLTILNLQKYLKGHYVKAVVPTA